MRVCDPYEKQISSNDEKAKFGAKRRVSTCSFVHVDRREIANRQTRRIPVLAAVHSFPHTPTPSTHSTPCLPSSPVPPLSPRSRLSPWPSATSPSAPPRPPSAYRASHPKFILLAPDRRRTSKRRDASTRTQTDIRRSPRSLRPRAIVNSGVTRRAAVAGVLALFVAQPVRPPSRSAASFRHRLPDARASAETVPDRRATTADSPFPSAPTSFPRSFDVRPPPRPSACARRTPPRRTAPTPAPCPSPRAPASASTRPPARSSRTSRRRS